MALEIKQQKEYWGVKSLKTTEVIKLLLVISEGLFTEVIYRNKWAYYGIHYLKIHARKIVKIIVVKMIPSNHWHKIWKKIVMKNSFLSELLKVLNEDTYCMLGFTTGFESINYKLKKKKIIYLHFCMWIWNSFGA